MKTFDVQGVHIRVPRSRAFALLADPQRLPRWTEAFEAVDDGHAVMRTPQGNARVALKVVAAAQEGTVDWRMTFPDGSVATAHSRIIDLNANECIYAFVLTPPPVPLEALEGALESQSRTLAKELQTLKRILESDET